MSVENRRKAPSQLPCIFARFAFIDDKDRLNRVALEQHLLELDWIGIRRT